ncbi:MAG: hypothetical protein ABR905_14495, partial [Terracidiphilus sp.]
MRSRSSFFRRSATFTLLGLVLGIAAICNAQTAKPVSSYPARLPYSFGNFVWWSDGDLRTLLKKRIPGLGDQIPTTEASIDRMRDALRALVKENGITADIYSQEPSYFGSARDPEAPEPSIQFSIIRPEILLSKVTLKVQPDDLTSLIHSQVLWGEGKPYSAFGEWITRSRIKEVLRQYGYLDGQAQIVRLQPFREGDHFQVGLAVTVIAGPQYHVSSLTADGGPLLAGRDLSRFFNLKQGDIPGRDPLAGLASELFAFYQHHGYADVEIENDPVLDRDHALVSYHLRVIPGAVYHLRSITVEKLTAEQESKARELLGMSIGDLYVDEAITNLYHKIPDEPLLKGYSFSFGP